MVPYAHGDLLYLQTGCSQQALGFPHTAGFQQVVEGLTCLLLYLLRDSGGIAMEVAGHRCSGSDLGEVITNVLDHGMAVVVQNAADLFQ